MFHRCQNEEEAKELYRRLAKRLHPDCGGEKELMILLKESHDIALNHIKSPASSAQFHDAGNVKPQPGPPSKPVEKVPSNDKRLEFVKDLIKLLMKVAVSPKTANFITSVLKFLEDNQFLTIQQYKALKDVYERLEVSSVRHPGFIKRSQRL
ncbi:MAG TPA: hypothetical protein VLE89_07360 [Chlamydiales bacterium]|nr:hypothetical protein [Chlamydiales bacterium]